MTREAPVEYEGFIAEYHEQGMEGLSLLIFQDAAYTSAGSWEYVGMHLISAGDHLTVLRPDGTVLWSGELRWRRLGWRGLWGERSLAPAGVEEREWLAWFAADPPLRARFRPAAPRARA